MLRDAGDFATFLSNPVGAYVRGDHLVAWCARPSLVGITLGGADLLAKVKYIAGYWGSTEGPALKDVHLRVEVMLELWDAKTQKQVGGLYHLGVIDDQFGTNTTAVPVATLPSGETLQNPIAKRSPDNLLEDVKKKVAAKIKDWITDVNQAKPAPSS